MWDRSYRWQRLARIGAGAIAVSAALVGVAVASGTDAAGRAADGIREISRETAPDAESTVICDVPAKLGVRQGGLVYKEGPDGTAEIVGRVIRIRDAGDNHEITVLLTPAAAGAMSGGGKIRGAETTLSVEHAFRLIISPDIPREEAKIARDTLWPAIKDHVLPKLKERVTKEVTESFDNLDQEDRTLLDKSLKELRVELVDLEEELLNRLANRAWEVIGVSGVAEGILRKTGDTAGNTVDDVKDWVKSWWGDKEEEAKRNSEFLSPERAAALRIALEEEVEAFMKEKDKQIKEKLNKVLNNRRAEFVDKFETKWGPKLYENALVPSWLEGEDGVLEAAESYANDFARRRLLTSEGGPRLLLAYALRSSLGITQDPLLVIAPSDTGRVEFEWIMPRMAKDAE
jgi:hypothetical protein